MSENLPIATILSEIDAIETDMSTNRVAYFKDEAKQARYRHLMEKKMAISASTLTLLNENPLPILSPGEFHAELKAMGVEGASYSEYLHLNRHVGDVLVTVPEQDQEGFIAAFENLPDEVAGAALDELMAHKPAVEWSSDDAVYAFSQMPEGAILTREWRHDARKNLATVRERLFRVIDRLESESAVARFMSWLEGLSTASAVAVYRKLAA